MIGLSLYLPRLPTDLARRRSRVDPSCPILLGRVDHQRELVAACCERAERSGVRAGMTVSQARALLRGPVHLEALDVAMLARALGSLAVRAVRFTPKVAIDAPDGLWLDATGCTHLYGGTVMMVEAVVAWFQKMGFEGRVAAAPFLGAAWALARFGRDRCCCVESTQIHAVLSPLPVAALRLSVEQQHALHEIGVETVGQLLLVPRAELARRYGGDPPVPRRIDQALGRDPESITPIRTRPPLAVGRMFAGPTDRTEPIALCVRQLLNALCARLERREAGCRELLLLLMRSDLPPVEITVRASTPVRDAKHWYTLLVPHLEQAHLGFGVEGITITARGLRTLRHVQASRWIDLTQTTNTAELARLTDTLMARLGPDQVLRMRPRASFLPERSFVLETAEAPDAPMSPNAPTPRVDRPSLLLSHPVPIEVVFLFPDGPIGRIRRDGESHKVVRCRGPERISGEWWLREGRERGEGGERGTRDYYQLHTDDGTWLWVFRACDSGRWFIHGEWA